MRSTVRCPEHCRLLDQPVHCYNRRGRAGSSPQPADYSAATEVADLATVLRETGASDVVAHSYGGFVALAGRPDAADPQDGDLRRRREPLREPHPALAARAGKRSWLPANSTTPGRIWCKAWRRPARCPCCPLGALRMLSILSARTRLGAEMRQLLPTAVAEMRAVLDADAELDGLCRHHHPHPHAQRRLEPRLLRRHEPPACRRRPRDQLRRGPRAAPRRPASGRESGWPSARPGSSSADPGLRPRRPSAWPAALQPRACRPGGGAVGPAAEGCDATDR